MVVWPAEIPPCCVSLAVVFHNFPSFIQWQSTHFWRNQYKIPKLMTEFPVMIDWLVPASKKISNSRATS